jgi:lauroyl/myristoyl acyltransferase
MQLSFGLESDVCHPLIFAGPLLTIVMMEGLNLVKKILYWLEWFFVSFFARLIPLMPFRLVRRLAALAGLIVYRFDPKSRAVALANLEAAFGDKLTSNQRQIIAKRSVQIFAQSFLELFWIPRINCKNIEQFIRFENPEAFRALCEAEVPGIMVTLHFGNFEWGSALFAFLGYQGIMLTQRFKNDRLTAIFARLRAVSGHEVVTQEGSIIRLLKALRRGKTVGILTDLTVKMGDPAVIIDAFSLKTRVTLAHSLLHERTRSPIIPFITLPRSDGGYIVRILPPLIFEKGTPYQEIAQTCWNQFEPIIREHPEHWLWAYKHWRYQPSTTDWTYPFYSNRSRKFDAELLTQENGKEEEKLSRSTN